ncbi:hypothetical protein [Paraburkholderia bannensis]|uniref:hypothetical protein n=1 Tax=Paraburkholderia bannensis TaxID=765414 RepID=UPI002ABD96D0|nr:hypothetical protein [Paraburkholderia bannensis]
MPRRVRVIDQPQGNLRFNIVVKSRSRIGTNRNACVKQGVALLNCAQRRTPLLRREYPVDLRNQREMNRAIPVDQPEQMFGGAQFANQHCFWCSWDLRALNIRQLVSHMHSVFMKEKKASETVA